MKPIKLIVKPAPNNSSIIFDWNDTTSSHVFQSLKNPSVFNLKSCFWDLFNEPQSLSLKNSF